MPKQPSPTSRPRERAFLVGVHLHDRPQLLPLEESLAELALLADTAGLQVIGQATQRLSHPDPKTFLGSGKVAEVKALLEENLADVVLFDEELSPRHQRELENAFGDEVRLIDRTALILDIFAQHAATREGAMQVELAQYEYRLPRLTRAWTHLARQAGGGGGRSGSVGGVGLRGPGETQLEVDRREIGRRIAKLKLELEKVRHHRQRYRSRRRKADLPTVALVGYTNAGKSTLLNRLAGSQVLVANQLFATLDPTTRRIQLPGGRDVLLTDTVGFIQKLPTNLIAAFRATLEEITEADLLLHVVDIAQRSARLQAQAVMETLHEIGVGSIPTITALNKIDLLPNPDSIVLQLDDFDKAVPISAAEGQGIGELLRTLEHELYEGMAPIKVDLPYNAGRLISLFHDQGQIERIENRTGSVRIEGYLPVRLHHEFEPYAHIPAALSIRAGSQAAGEVPPGSESDPHA
jgi:GTP-binding protein HflX